jgi:hypothetical protein
MLVLPKVFVMGFDDPAFVADAHGGFCCVDVEDYGTVVIVRNPSSMEVMVYRDREDDCPMDSIEYPKEDFENA